MDTVKPHLQAVSFIHYGPQGNGKPRWFHGWRCTAVVDGIEFKGTDHTAESAFRRMDDRLFIYNLEKLKSEERRKVFGDTLHARVDPRFAELAATLATPGKLVEIKDPPRSWLRRLFGR